MGKPLSEIKNLVAEKAQQSTSTLKGKMNGWVNQKYEELWHSFNWKEITVIDEALTLTAASDRLMLPAHVGQMISLTERATNIIITPASPFVFQHRYLSARASQASPIGYVEAGSSPTLVELSTADTITVVSSLTDDVHDVRVSGRDGNGTFRTEVVSLNGTTDAPGTITFAAGGLSDVAQGQRSSGVISIKETTSDATLDRISPEDFNNKYIIVRLQGPADSARTVYLSYKERFRLLRHDEDSPRFSCEEALVSYCFAQVLKVRGKYEQAREEERIASDLVGALVTEKDILGAGDHEQSLPHVDVGGIDIPYFGGGVR